MSFTFGSPFCPQCGKDVDADGPDEELYCEDCVVMFKEYGDYVADAQEKAVLIDKEFDLMADWEAQRYGY